MRTREQEWAQSAYERVRNRDRENKDKGWRDKYLSLARGFPQLVKTSGFAHAIAFVLSRDEKAYNDFLQDVAATLRFKSVSQLEEQARTASLPEYTRLTRQVLGVSQWYRRYVDIFFGKDSGDGEAAEGGMGR